MIDLNDKDMNNQKAEPTYVPELDITAFTKKDTTAGVIKELDLMRQNGVAQLYFGDTRLNTEEKEDKPLPIIGTFGTITRGLGRGWTSLGAKIGQAYKFGESWFANLFTEIEEKDQYIARKAVLDVGLRRGEITQEEYDKGIQDLSNYMKEAVKFDLRQKDIETQKAKRAYDKINLWNARVNESLKINRKEYENHGYYGVLSDVFESVPTSLAAMAGFFVTKNPAVVAAIYGGTAGASQVAEITGEQLEAGKSLEDALGIGAITTTASMPLDFIGLKFLHSLWTAPVARNVAKKQLFGKIVDFVYKNPKSKNIANTLGIMVRGGAVGFAEEGLTETAQSVIETNVPRIMGYGKEYNGFFNEIMDYGYEGFIGAVSGSLFGGVGTGISTHVLKKQIKQKALKSREEGGLGLKESEAEDFANEIAPVIVQYQNAKKAEILEQVDKADVSPTAAREAVKQMFAAVEPKDYSTLRESLEKSLDARNPQGKGNANTIAANMLLAAAMNQAQIEGCSVEEIISQTRVDILNDSKDINISDKFYNARNEKGDIQGAVSKNLGEHIIYLLNTATPDVLIHEATHLYLNSVAAAIRSGKVNAQFSETIGNIIDIVGAPEEADGTFSDAQQEKLANLFQEIARTGQAPTAELSESFEQMSNIVKGAYVGAKKAKMLSPEGKKLFSDFFSKKRAKTNFELKEKEIARLKETVDKILRGERVSVSDYRLLSKLLRFGEGYAPDYIGYSVEDFIMDNPEYKSKNDSEKRVMLENAGFEIANDRTNYPDDTAAVQEIESKAERVFSSTDTEAIARRDEIERYKNLAKAYKEVFENNRAKVMAIKEAMKVLRQSGYVVTDKESVKQVSKGIKDLKREIASLSQQLDKANRQPAEKAAKSTLDFIDNLLFMMAETQANTDVLEKESNDLRNNLKNLPVKEIYTKVNDLVRRAELLSNQIVEEFYNSDRFIYQSGVETPTVKEAELKASILNTIAQHIPTDGKPLDYRKMEVSLARLLRKKKVSDKYANLILRELRMHKLGVSNTLSDVVDRIVNKVSVEYHKLMNDKYSQRWKELRSDAKGKKLYGSDNIAVLYIDGILKEINEAANEGGTRAEKQQKINEVLQKHNLKEDVIGKDENGVDHKLNDEQFKLATAMISERVSYLTKDYSYSNQALLDGYIDISKFAETTQAKVEQLEEEKKQAYANAVQEVYKEVSGRKALPKGLQSIDNAIFAGQLGGLRSNLKVVLGDEIADKYDVTVEYRKTAVEVQNIQRSVERKTSELFRGRANPKTYFKKLRFDMPYANVSKSDKIGNLLKDYSRGEILDLYMISKNEKGMTWVERTFGKDTEAVLKRINQDLSRIDKSFASILMQEMEAIYPELAKTYFEINGRPLGYQSDYWPLYVMNGSNKKMVRDEIHENISVPVTKKDITSTQERTGVATDPNVNPTHVLKLANPVEKFNRYINAVTKFKNVVPKLNQLSSILFGDNKESEALRQAIEEKFGKGMLKAIRDDIRYNLGVLPYEELDFVHKVASEIVKNFVVAAIAKPYVGFKQLVSIINYADGVPSLQYLGGLLRGMANPIKTWKEMMSYASVRNRLTGELPNVFTRGILEDTLLEALPFKGEKVAKFSAFIEKLRTLATIPVRVGDITSVVFGGYSYLQYQKSLIESNPEYQSLSESEKKKYLDNILENRLIVQTETTQQSGLSSTKGGLQRAEGEKSALLKQAFMFFTSAQVQFGRRLREDLYGYKNGTVSKKQLTKTFAIYALANPIIFAILSNLGTFAGMLRDMRDGDEDWKDKLYLMFFRPVVDSIASMWGSLGGAGTYLSDKFAESIGQKTYGASLNITPFFLQEIEKSWGKKNKDADDWWRAIFSVAQATSPVPLQTSKKMIKSFIEMVGGKDPAINFLIFIGMSERQAKELIEE